MSGLSGSVKNNTILFAGIGIGGALGSCLRYAASLTLQGSFFPFSTLTVNLAGCFFLTYLTEILTTNRYFSAMVKKAILVGLLGSFTTFSTFSLEIYLLAMTNIWISLFYLLLSIGGGTAACWLGYRLAAKRRMAK